jgi:mRNA-degrading endonuclease toxin of MazEF toxin-antitoxin module
MRQWDVFDFNFAHPIGLHPAVILSPDEVATNPDAVQVDVLIVTTVRGDYRPGRYDVMLNGADGLDHLSRVRVSPIVLMKKSEAGRKWGVLSATRQKLVAKKIREVYRLG